MIAPETKNKHIKEAMDTLLKMFNEDNLPKVAKAVFKGREIPSDHWSFLNRILMYLNDTEDARGFKQWQQAGRYVKKGSKAFYILAPMFKKVIEEKNLRIRRDRRTGKTDTCRLQGYSSFQI